MQAYKTCCTDSDIQQFNAMAQRRDSSQACLSRHLNIKGLAKQDTAGSLLSQMRLCRRKVQIGIIQLPSIVSTSAANTQKRFVLSLHVASGTDPMHHGFIYNLLYACISAETATLCWYCTLLMYSSCRSMEAWHQLWICTNEIAVALAWEQDTKRRDSRVSARFHCAV